MSTLYEINSRYMAALEAATDPDNDMPVEAFTDTLQGIEGEAEDKLKNVIAYARNLEAEAAAIKDAAEAMEQRMKAKQKKAQWLKDYARYGMHVLGKSKLEWPEFSARIQANPPAVEIVNADEIPDDYVKHTVQVSIDKAAIRDRLKQGGFIPGAILRQGESLRVR